MKVRRSAGKHWEGGGEGQEGWGKNVKDIGIVSLAKELGLLGMPPNCLTCRTLMVEVKDTSAPDGLKWRCNGKIVRNKKKSKACTYRRAYRAHTFFDGTHLELWKVLGFVDLWLKKMQLNHIGELLSLAKHTGITVFYSFFFISIYLYYLFLADAIRTPKKDFLLHFVQGKCTYE